MTPEDKARIHFAMARAESGTTARVAVRFVNDRNVDAFERAKAEFEQQQMHTHKHHNAALILVAPNARQFAMIGDRELHARVSDAFWKDGIAAMRSRFAVGDIPGAVVAGLDHLGVAFHEHFAQ